NVDALGKEPGLLPELTSQCADQALSTSYPSTREEPDGSTVLLVTQEEDAAAPAQDRRDPDAGVSHGQCADEPKPRDPRSLAVSSSTSTSRTEATGATTSCAILIPGTTSKWWLRSVLRRTTRISPRYPESIRPGEFTTPIPFRAARPERGCTKPAYPSGISTAIPVPTSARSPGASVSASQAARSMPASPSYACRGSTASGRRRRTATSINGPRPRRRPLRQRGSGRSGRCRAAVAERGYARPRRWPVAPRWGLPGRTDLRAACRLRRAPGVGHLRSDPRRAPRCAP